MTRNAIVISNLQKNVIAKFGKPITTATDCANLAELLGAHFHAQISAQTIRRFFGIIDSTSKPSIFTLNLLSKFSGFQDFQDFYSAYSNQEMKMFFGESHNEEKDYWEKSEQLCRQISQSAEMLVNTHHELMAYPMARKYFIENHPMRDMMSTVYFQYFMTYLKYNDTNEAKIFAYGFLYQGAFLTQNAELTELSHRKIKETPLCDEVFVIPAGLKFGVQLQYADFIGDEVSFKKTFAEMKKARLRYVAASERSVCSFEYSVLELLIFTNRLQEIKFLVDHQTQQKAEDLKFVPAERIQTHREVWNILCATAYEKLGDLEKCKYYFNQIDLNQLGFGWKNYYSILYHFVELKLVTVEEHPKILKKIEKLIDSTYFYFYRDKLRIATEHLSTQKEIYSS